MPDESQLMHPSTAGPVTLRGDRMAVPASRKSGRNEKNDRPVALLTALRVALLPRTRIDALSGDPNFMTSLARGLSVIQCFSNATSFLTVSQISQATGFSRASVRRCLYTLSKLGLAKSEDGAHFTLLPRVLTLGHSYISSMPLSKVAQPVLDRLSQFLRESCSIAMLDGADVIHVAHANISRVLAVDLSMGSRLPAIYTSMGRALLAHLPARDLEAHLARAEFFPHTKHSLTDIKGLRLALQLVRRDGFALVDQELELGLCALAVPLRNAAGRVIAALNVGAPVQRVSAQSMVTKFVPQLQEAAQELSVLLK
jgi:IclR family pca regulon transcriptional regulator